LLIGNSKTPKSKSSKNKMRVSKLGKKSFLKPDELDLEQRLNRKINQLSYSSIKSHQGNDSFALIKSPTVSRLTMMLTDS
jgi:hypothetical protein